MPNVRLFVVDVEGVTFVQTPSTIAASGIDQSDLDVFEEAGKWWDIPLKAPTFGLQEEARRQALVPDPVLGFRLDEGKLPATRAAVMIETWPAWKWSSFEELPPNVANVLNAEIEAVMYPNIASNADFMAAWRRRRESSQAEEAPQKGSAK